MEKLDTRRALNIFCFFVYGIGAAVVGYIGFVICRDCWGSPDIGIKYSTPFIVLVFVIIELVFLQLMFSGGE
jgi:hypothetical protein